MRTIVTILTLSSAVMSQECNMPDRDVKNLLMMHQKHDWTLSDCPCYHHQTTNYSCITTLTTSKVPNQYLKQILINYFITIILLSLGYC